VAEGDNDVDNVDVDKEPVTRLVGCGFPHKQKVDVRIVDRESRTELPEGSVGEIWVRSPSKAAGYFGNEQATLEDFGATLSDQPLEEYLRTGDLGFFYETELFICGRLKDLIIVAGRNYYPQDIEATAEATSDELRPGCSAAFTIDVSSGGGGEEVALLMELRTVPGSTVKIRELCDPLAETVRASVQREHSLGISEVVFLATKTVPKTSSGKIARSWCRKGFLAGTLQTVYRKSFVSGGGIGGAGVGVFEIEGGEASTAHGGSSQAAASATAPLTPDEITALRATGKAELMDRLRTDVARTGQLPPDSIDYDTALVTILDSLCISQFSGRLQSAYSVRLSDEYLFRESVTVRKLAEVVKLGYAPDDGDGSGAMVGAERTNGGAAASELQSGKAEGLAGALGCPPGVRVCCVIQ